MQKNSPETEKTYPRIVILLTISMAQFRKLTKIETADHKISENKDNIEDLDESLMKVNKELVHVKKQRVNYCGYQSSWNTQDTVLTYEYLSVEENTVFKNEGLTSDNDP